MNYHYDDIRNRIPVPPDWFDESAVPRYVTFGPDCVSNIYAREVALVEIACQSCATKFRVAFSRCTMDDVRAKMAGQKPRTLADSIADKTIHYGDPPNIRCCPAGPTMNSDPLRVLEYWLRDAKTDHEWHRISILEVDVSDEASAESGDRSHSDASSVVR